MFTGNAERVEDIAVSVELVGDKVLFECSYELQDHKYMISSEMNVPSNVSHFFFSHFQNTSFGIDFCV